jgi:hypothetical protein
LGRLPAALLVAACGLALYLVTMAPTVLWGDDAELQRIVLTGEARTVGQSSRASHLLWLVLTRSFVGTTAWLPLDAAGRTTLVSALAGGTALGFVYLAGRELARPWAPRPWLAGALAAAGLGLSHTFWLLAVRPAVYTLSMALLALATWAVLRWRLTARPAWLALCALASAAALTNHVLILASGPGLTALVVAVPRAARPRLIGAAAAAGALAVTLLAGLAWRGVPLDDLVRVVAAYRPQFPPLRDIVLVPFYLLYQFPLAMPLALWGAFGLWRADPGAALGVALLYAGNVLLVLLQSHPGIAVRDEFLFFLPSYLPVALVLGVGGATLVERTAVGRGKGWWVSAAAVAALVLAPLLIYPLAAHVAGAVALRLAPARPLPWRDPVTYYLLPAKGGYGGARTYGDSVMATLEPGAAIVADWLPYQTLRYLQAVEGRRPDVLLAQINAGTGQQLPFLLQHAGRRPLYLADAAPPPYYDLAEIERCFALTARGPAYRLEPRTAPAASGAGCD